MHTPPLPWACILPGLLTKSNPPPPTPSTRWVCEQCPECSVPSAHPKAQVLEEHRSSSEAVVHLGACSNKRGQLGRCSTESPCWGPQLRDCALHSVLYFSCWGDCPTCLQDMRWPPPVHLILMRDPQGTGLEEESAVPRGRWRVPVQLWKSLSLPQAALPKEPQSSQLCSSRGETLQPLPAGQPLQGTPCRVALMGGGLSWSHHC